MLVSGETVLRAPSDPRGGDGAEPARAEQDGEKCLGLPDRRRRPGRPRRRGLRGDRGALDDPRRLGRARRPGEHLLADRELPRLPGGGVRVGPGRAGDRPGAALRPAHRGARSGRSACAPRSGRYVVELDSGDELAARTVVLATGASYRQLPVEGIERLNGAGVFYAATLVESRMCGSEAVGRGRRRQLGGPGGDLPLRHAERVYLLLRGGDLRRGDVELPGRPDRGDRQHRGPALHRGPRGPRRRRAGRA